MILGICGKIGSGKTLLSEFFKNNQNSYIINCDKLASELINDKQEILELISKNFGSKLIINNQLNKKMMRKIVFNDKKSLYKLNQIVHPFLFNEVKNILNIEELKSEYSYIVVEAAVLYEASLYKLVDKIIWVSAKLHNILQRVSLRDKDKRKNIENIYKIQKSYNEVQPEPDIVIENNKTVNEFKKKAGSLVASLNK
ncbi:MAG: dephospho-CoA kinase [Candidatus Muiribacteriota bacterium]